MEIAEFNASETTSPLNQENSKNENPQLSNSSNQTTSIKNTESENMKTNAELDHFVYSKTK